MKKFGFEKIENILGSVVQNLKIDEGLNKVTLFNIWPQVIGERFKNKTRAVSLSGYKNNCTLTVAVASGAIAQDLFFFKKDILSKIQKSALPLGFKVRDIVFNHKIWNEFQNDLSSENYQSSIKLIDKKPTEAELEAIELPENIISQIQESLEASFYQNNDIKERFFKTMVNDIKLQIWRKYNGFPSCKYCGITLNYIKENTEPICPSCAFEENNK